MLSKTNKCQLLQFPKIEDERGNLSFLETGQQLPFGMARAYWIYDVPGGEQHGGHAYRSQEECLIALSGSFDVRVRSDRGEEIYSLNRSYMGLYLPAGNWRSLENFSTNALGLVLSSGAYDPAEYIRDFAEPEQMLSSLTNHTLSHTAAKQTLLKKESVEVRSPNQVFSVQDCRLLELPTHHDREGNLTAVNGERELPFALKRLYYVYDIPYGSQRGGHAHKELKQWVISASSCFDVLLDDGREQKRFRLDRPNLALEIPAGIWREISGFASGAVVLVLASAEFSEADYIRDYEQFLAFRSCK
ncbi:MAG: FdtA/QdtA family cupin domain-containing protein [Bacteroidales bacterium]|nr:FdtA/QdtA family cupin domain-containing protein [Bacteroidales bacterium]MDD3430680.1 FdtA/QdtA family cupin domain-containing protein [Bacteroidales bacterium]MDD4361364.1 FdtA/QdtA family cupin domain-containing protein [Bacteroidales bacterium]